MTEPKRILLVADNPYTGGVTSHILSILAAMRGQRRFEFLVACFPGRNEDAALIRAAERLGTHVHVFTMAHPFDIRVLKAYRTFLNDNHIQVVHTHGYRGNVIAALARTPLPVVSTCHGEIVEPALRTRLWQWLSLRAMRRHARVIACSDYVRRWLIDKGLAETRVVTVHNSYAPTEAELGLGVPRLPDELVVLYVGRLVAGKGLDTLLEAAVGIEKMLVVLVGDGPLRDSLEAQACRLGVRVHFAGAMENPTPYYRRADVVVLPSRMEAMPMVLIEAAAHAKPVIATRVGGIPEIVSDDQTGILIESSDAGQLHDALDRIRDPGLRAAMGQHALERWRNGFSPEIMADRLVRIYEELLR